MRRTHLLLLACLLLALPLRAQEEDAAAASGQPDNQTEGQPAARKARAHQLVVLSAVPDVASGTLTVNGIDFGDEAPRVTLGVLDLDVITHDAGTVVASLPAGIQAGTYLLIVARGAKVSDYDVFHLSVPAAAPPERPAPARPKPAPAPRRSAGATGGGSSPGAVIVTGPAGPQGPPGPAGNLALAGKRCPAGSMLVGFDEAGNLACEPLVASAAVAAPEQPAAATVAAPSSAAAPESSTACVDEAGDGADLPDSWDPRVPVLASYPQSRDGVARGTFATAADRDHFSIFARENDRGICWTDAQDRPIRAELVLTAPPTAAAAVCACWSTPGAPCSRSANRCASAAAGGTATLEVPMRMVCGEDDEGTLDVEVHAAGAAPACAPWSLAWSLRE